MSSEDDYTDPLSDLFSAFDPPSGKSPRGTGGVLPAYSSPYRSSRGGVAPIRWSSSRCGGFVGKGKNLLCTRLHCSTLTHKKNRLEVDVDTLFIPSGRIDSCFRTPSLSLSDFDSSVIQEALLQPREPDEMRRVFALFNSASSETLLALDKEGLTEFIGDNGKAAWAPRTPADMKTALKKPRDLSDRLDIIREEGSARKYLSDLESAVNEFSAIASPASEDPMTFMISEFPKVHEAMGSVLGLVKSLYGAIIENKDEADHGMMKLMKNLQLSLSGIYSTIGAFDKEEGSLQEFGNDLTSVLTGVSRCVSDLQEALGMGTDSDIEPSQKRPKLVDRVSDVEKTLHTQVIGRMGVLAKEVLALKARADEAEPITKARRSASDMDEEETPPVGFSRQEVNIDRLIDDVTEARDKLAFLEDALESVRESRGGSDTGKESQFKIGGHDLSDPKVAKLFLTKAGAYGRRAGFFYDCFSMGVYAVEKDSEDKIARKAAAHRAQVSTSVHDQSVILSFGYARPPQFGQFKEISQPKSPKDPTFVLPLVRCYADLFNPNRYQQHSVMTAYEEAYKLINIYLNALDYKIPMDSPARPVVEVARIMNEKTINFMRDLQSQIDFFNNQITSEALGASADEAWALVSEMLSAILSEINDARTEMYGADVFEEEDQSEIVCQSLVNTFRAHAKMDEIRRIGFSKHPCVVPALSLHLFSRKASIHTIIVLQERVGSLENLLKEYMKSQFIGRTEFDQRLNGLKALIDKNNAKAAGKKDKP